MRNSASESVEFIRFALIELASSRVVIFGLGILFGGYVAVSAMVDSLNSIPFSSLCDTVPAVSGN